MKYARYLLLLLWLTSCASRQTVRHHNSYQADIRPDVPVSISVPASATDGESVLDGQNTVVSARPLISQVQRAPQGTWQAAKQQALNVLCQSPLFETTQLGLYIYDLTDGQPLYAVNAAHRMRPASCQKLVTAITALHLLGGSYQLQTDFCITGKISNRVLNGDLHVVGGMDPLVTADELLQTAAAIKQQVGIDSINGKLIYDLSMREEAPFGQGWCWDDDYGPLSALLVDGKDTFQQDWLQALSLAGIKVPSPTLSCDMDGKEAQKEKSGERKPVCTIRHSIDNLLKPMMKKSHNICAECLFYQVAASTGKKGAGIKQARQCIDGLMEHIGLQPDKYRVADGSGLSLYNYVTPEMLVAFLTYAWRTESIREHLLPSLPIAGIDGTLQKRMAGTEAAGNVRAKTGTVMGVSSLAGYLTASNGHVLAFAIINQGVSKSTDGHDFQDKVCREMCR